MDTVIDPTRIAAVFAGASVGAGTRWLVGTAFGDGGIDASLFVVNLLGTALLAMVTAARPGRFTPRTRALLTAGFCGSLTTWSALAVRTASELDAGRWIEPGAWLAANVLAGAAVALLVHRVAATRRGGEPLGGAG